MYGNRFIMEQPERDGRCHDQDENNNQKSEYHDNENKDAFRNEKEVFVVVTMNGNNN